MWAAARNGGLTALLNVIEATIWNDFVGLSIIQALAAFGLVLALDYRHKPRFACAAVIQFSVLLLRKVLKHVCLSAALSNVLPLALLGTLLLYATSKHETDYLNPALSSEGKSRE
jgi:hypothetical protein